MDELYLVFINKIGNDWKDKFIYEFIFSHTTKDIDGEDWDVYPASGQPNVPSENFISKVGRLEAKLNLDVIQDSDTFAVWDAVDGIISMAWENINDYEEYPESRLYFKFGESIEKVEEKLYALDLTLEYKYNKNEQIEE